MKFGFRQMSDSITSFFSTIWSSKEHKVPSKEVNLQEELANVRRAQKRTRYRAKHNSGMTRPARK